MKKDNDDKNGVDLSTAGVVYRAECLRCKDMKKCSIYIGETSRKLNERIKEHLAVIKNHEDFLSKENRASALQIHGYKEHKELSLKDIQVEILHIERNSQRRKIREAMCIKEMKPTLNFNRGFELIA